MSIDRQPILRGELLELRPLRAEDWAELYAVAADPLIWEQHPNKDRYQEAVFREFFREALESGGALVARDNKNGKLIGSSRFHGYDPDQSEIEIGWTFLARSYWGGVYNGEMKRLMLEHAFRYLDHVIFMIGPKNHRSRRAVEKIGGVLVGSKLNDKGRESVVYRLTAFRFGALQADSLTIRRATTNDGPLLLDIWLRSVRATHTFLSEADIQSLLPHVKEYLSSEASGLLVLCSRNGVCIGFMGMKGNKMDSLFLAPEYQGCGCGRRLVEHARALHKELTVDVNEQNPAALGFYQKCGFIVEGRSPVDDAGRPFPLVHLRLK